MTEQPTQKTAFIAFQAGFTERNDREKKRGVALQFIFV
jgi:hypothetical protein